MRYPRRGQLPGRPQPDGLQVLAVAVGALGDVHPVQLQLGALLVVDRDTDPVEEVAQHGTAGRAADQGGPLAAEARGQRRRPPRPGRRGPDPGRCPVPVGKRRR
ncbi:hypothetical protein OG204_20370 [Streptomyces sp. NBC_01387]|uniref:hypothetical protein n=1 Tax=Streptomyces sp. NBC_01387 TaxID=2903849 RepID=UPI0032495943